MTCVLATLTVLANYWNHPVSHLETAEEICYDGTPHHSQRLWAERHGWELKEFTITESAMVNLIENDLPFAMSTTGEGHGHCQAVVGCDQFKGVMLIRDSNHRSIVESSINELLKSQISSGPRGFVMVPQEHASKLRALEFPELELYDEYDLVLTELERHHREVAYQAYMRLEQKYSGHRITRHASSSIAHYDKNLEVEYKAIDALHQLFSTDVNFQIRRIQLMRNLKPTDELISELRKAVYQPHSLLLLKSELARELTSDARYWDESRRVFARSKKMKNWMP